MNEPILVIEDDSSINQLICEALSRAEYRPGSAYSGSEAILMMDTKSWKCVILDLMLSGKSGEEVLSAIRRNGNMPVIYVTKPFDIDELLEGVAAQLRRINDAEISPVVFTDMMAYTADPSRKELKGNKNLSLILIAHENSRVLLYNTKAVN